MHQREDPRLGIRTGQQVDERPRSLLNRTTHAHTLRTLLEVRGERRALQRWHFAIHQTHQDILVRMTHSATVVASFASARATSVPMEPVVVPSAVAISRCANPSARSSRAVRSL